MYYWLVKVMYYWLEILLNITVDFNFYSNKAIMHHTSHAHVRVPPPLPPPTLPHTHTHTHTQHTHTYKNSLASSWSRARTAGAGLSLQQGVVPPGPLLFQPDGKLPEWGLN